MTSRSDAVGAKSQIANPALEPLAFLVGDWRTESTHPLLPGLVLAGRTSFAWHEGGAFLRVRSEVDHPAFPDGVALLGSDDAAGSVTMIYFDERGVSRRYEVTVGDGTLTWRRDDPKLAQSNTITAEDGGDRLVSKGRMSQNGGAWGDDLAQVFHRDGRAEPA